MALRYVGRFIIVVLFAISILVSSSHSIQAFRGECDYGWFETNEIRLYDPCHSVCGEGGTAASYLSGSNNRQKIYNFWVAQGLSPAQAAGITGSLQAEGGFSAFRQEISQSWPNGGYGIAKFTGGQRVQVTNALSAALGDTFTKYYVADYGGAVTATTGFVPSGVPATVNDKFLLGELNYLATYIAEFIPSSYSLRVDGLSSDYNITIQKDQKLLPFLKTLSSAGDVAKAWTYLYEYEYPADIKNTAAVRAGFAASILTELGSSSQAAATCSSSIGTGGLTFEQANKLMTDYMNNGASWFSVHGFSSSIYQSGPVTGGYCTVFVAYFEDRFSKALPAVYDGTSMANRVVSLSGGLYTSGNRSSVTPYTVLSFTPLHTSIVLGINDDGSVIVGEMWRGGRPQAKQMEVHNKGTAVGRVGLWDNIDTYTNYSGTVTGIAIPSASEIDSISSRLDQYFGEGSGGGSGGGM